MPAAEQLAVFLRVIAQVDSYRSVCEIFQYSLETVSRNFRQVLQGVLTLKDDYIVLPDSATPCHPHIRNNSHFYPYFKDILGAIDGTHISAIVPVHKQNQYRNRKDFISQNVMAAVSFDRQFVYVASGWEGSAADMRVFKWATEQGDFSVPQNMFSNNMYSILYIYIYILTSYVMNKSGKMYLVDSGYANNDKLLAPVCRVQYHLSSFRNRSQ
ncbi:hypothetical protein AXF42_Ash006888 [Apostasia shenzhenica]|uniref:Uncharacterized protein n=1 Tax=Apostasia shenzhenica TaxID=1088818 RepID=A0A2I0BEG4_9ASPA|nr:hypothetical protein AXF42_Ash006888 [Apostasia shenzhenica]